MPFCIFSKIILVFLKLNVTQRLRDRQSGLIQTLLHRLTRSQIAETPCTPHTLHIGHRLVIFTTNRVAGVGDSSVTPAQSFIGENLFN